MFGFSIGEVLLLFVIALIVIGPRQLPDFARQLGRIINEIKRAAGDFTEEFKSQVQIDLNESSSQPKTSQASPDEYAQHIAVDSQNSVASETQTSTAEDLPPGVVPDATAETNDKKDTPS